jgi:hypothetical protein
MARIEITIGDTEVLYSILNATGRTGEVIEAPEGVTMPETLAYTMGLIPSGYHADGTVAMFTRYADCGSDLRVGRELPPPESTLVFRAVGDGRIAEGYDWKLCVRPEAVKDCHLRLGQTHIEPPYPASSKAGFRASEHRQATMLVDAVERKKRRQGFA